MSKAPTPPDPGDFFRIYLAAVQKTSPGTTALRQVDRSLRELLKIGARAANRFDSVHLAYHLGAIAITARPGIWRGHSGRIGMLTYGNRPEERLTIRDIRNMRENVSEVLDRVINLNRTPLVAMLRATGKISGESALAGADLDPDKGFAPLLGIHPPVPADPHLSRLIQDLTLVEHRAREYSQRSQALIDLHLRRFIRYILETTRAPQDRIVVDLLSPLKIMHCSSTDELKRWRNYAGLRQQVTRRQQK